MSDKEWLNAAMQDAYDSGIDRTITAARQRRRDWLDALHPWTQSQHTEHEREAAEDQLSELDSQDSED